MPKLDDQIATLQDRLTQLKRRQQRADARTEARELSHERKLDVRRKILLGGIVLAKLEDRQLDAAQVRAWLDAALTRAADRRLFDLPPLEPAPPAGSHET